MTETLLNKISKYSNDTIVTDAWLTGQTGEIVDLKGDCVFRFIDFINDGELRLKHTTEESKLSCPIVATGLVGFWLHRKDDMGVKTIFEDYFKLRLQEYEKAHESDDDAWDRDLKKEFTCRYHIPNEKKWMKVSEALLAYVTDNDKKKVMSISANYLKFVRAKRKELYPPNHPADRVIEDTFLDAFRMGGPAYECMSWMRTEYNLPNMGPHWNFNGKTEKEYLSGKWKEHHEVTIPEYIAEEFEDFNDGVLMYTNGGLMEEIHENLKKCQNYDDRVRYIISLLQPFKEFAEAFDSKEQIDERERSITEHKKWIKDWEATPDDAIDERTGKPIRPKDQIAACIETIERYKNDIAYWKQVQEDFYWFAQHGLGAGDYRTYPQPVNDEMCQYLGRWWSCMITFARRLASLALIYGIKLMDVQEECKVYLMWHFVITDYVDNHYITSTEHAKKLLNDIDSKKSNKKIETISESAADNSKTDKSEKPKESEAANVADSDFIHIKDYQDNDDLDYYLSENHWNFHVNSLLYKNLLVFHDGQELGAFLDVNSDNVTKPIKDYTALYGALFNEAYRLCHDVLTLPVPDTKVAHFADQAATWKFRNLTKEDGSPLKLVPNVIDLIESYHILGMANTILSLANDHTGAVDRFLIALSVYKDKGLYFCMYTHCFEPYSELYQAFICTTLTDGTYLRPGYDYKGRDEHLRKNMAWYKNFAEELDRKIKEEEAKKNSSESASNENKRGSSQNYAAQAKKRKKSEKPSKNDVSDKPKTLKYYVHTNKGYLNKQEHRVNIVFQKVNDWGWVDSKTTAQDFDSFFEGEPKHCNINWTGGNTVLTILLQELIKQPYIQEQTGCFATSLVKKQFGLTPNSDRKRLDYEAEEKIQIILYILNPRNPLPERKGRNGNEEEDLQDSAFKAVLSGELRSTKGI